jgi:hypothetical protein
MSVLKRRIARQGRDVPAWQPAVPGGTMVPPGQPGLLRVDGDGAGYTSLNPLYAADNGAPYPVTGPGSASDQLHAAGRP